MIQAVWMMCNEGPINTKNSNGGLVLGANPYIERQTGASCPWSR